MLKKAFTSFLLAVENIRSHFFHTLLSVLGIVIGVAALVSILSLIDGMEKYAQEQIATTTSLNGIVINSEQQKVVNGVKVQRDSVAFIDYAEFNSLRRSLTRKAQPFIRTGLTKEITISPTKVVGASILYTYSTLQPGTTLKKGKLFSENELNNRVAVVVLNEAFVRNLYPAIDSVNVVGSKILVNGTNAVVIGIVSEKTTVPQCFLPISLLDETFLRSHPPTLMFEANVVNDVPVIKNQISEYLKNAFPGRDGDFNIVTNEYRVQQAMRGFFLFRVIMGLIVGISVVVGGIGVMNVLLISVTERTTEIGIRKAMGATRKDIVVQFLSESVTISTFGCFLGLVLGVLATMAFIPIIKALTEMPFQAAYTLNTLIVISIVAFAIGIIFGTYPAMRASKLDPVEAIRRNE